MGQIALHVSDDLNKPFAGFIEFAGGVPRIIQCDPDGRGVTLERTGVAEADYCRDRAEAETKRAMATVHPAARKAHFEMATAYTKRELAARLPEARDAVEWFNPVRQASG